MAGLFLLLLGAFGLRQTWTLEMGNPRNPGPGFFPLWIALALCALAAAVLVSLALGRAQEAPIQWPSRPILLRLGLCLAILVGYALALERVGYLASTLLLTGLLSRVVFQRAWVPSVVLAALSVGTSWALFVWMLGVRLPGVAWW